VWGNGSELQQMLLNLLINAEQALVTVERPRTLVLRTTGTQHDVTLACVDNGPGIPADIRDRIFDPFFTTKPEGVGTGLGLSICYGIVRDHGGRLTVESDATAGVAFLATLPRDPRTQARTPRQRPGVGPGDAAALSVLLVDDEAGLRKAVARFFNRRGMRCRAVGDGAEALEVLHVEDFDVIISDVRMPGMSGREFLERLRADRPELVRRVIFSTGDTFAPETSALLKASGLPSLVKPFDFDQLEALAREVAAKVSA
jgi:two-component system NtrC family sensor kinase